MKYIAHLQQVPPVIALLILNSIVGPTRGGAYPQGKGKGGVRVAKVYPDSALVLT